MLVERRNVLQALTVGLPAASLALASRADGMRAGGTASAGVASGSVAGGSSALQREANKDVARAYIRACDDGDIARIGALVSPDAKWWILGRQDYDRDTIMAINQKRYVPGALRKSQVLGMTVEGDRVAVEYETAGSMGYDIFHHVFIVRDGVIVSGREYLDPPPLAKPFKESQAAIFTRVPWKPEYDTAAVEEQTRNVVTAFVGPKQLSPELRAPDFRWWLTGVGSHDLDRYLANLTSLMKSRPRSPVVRDNTKTIGIAVEGNRAAVEVARNLIFADHDYLDHFHLSFVLRDGKIAEMHEHTDVQAAVRGGLPVLEAIQQG